MGSRENMLNARPSHIALGSADLAAATRVRVEIDGIGAIENDVVAERSA
jgi:2-keto-4-pentenoate hydratase/2-oxohepta-3-ene-1,7-dioic acid hydratase in catechol pathway